MENREHRVASVELIVPSQATKADLDADIASRAEASAGAELNRRHFEVVGEELRAELRKIVDSQAAELKTLEAMRANIVRLLRPEASRKRR
ncbi:MAG: hypothetical protein ABMA15_27810 [Vicinamibacterales bacterium]